MKINTINKINKLKNIHKEIELKYINYILKYVNKQDFEYKCIDLPNDEYIQKNFFTILMLLIMDNNRVENLISNGLVIHAIRNVITNTDNIIDNDSKGNLDIVKLENLVLKNVMSLLIANDILENELTNIVPKIEDVIFIKNQLLKSIYEIAKGEEARKIINNKYMSYDKVIQEIHTKIGGELLAISMIVPQNIYKSERIFAFKDALFKIGLSLQLLDDITDIKEDYEANTQNAFFSYLLEKGIKEEEIIKYIYDSKNLDISKFYNDLIKCSIDKGLEGFLEFEKNGLEIGYKDGLKLMEFMFTNRNMKKEWQSYIKNV